MVLYINFSPLFLSFQNRLRCIGILGAALLTILQLRLMLPGPTTLFSTADNPTAKSNSLWTRFLTFTYLPVFNFKLMLYPTELSFDWGMDAIPRVSSLFDRRNLWTAAFYASLSYSVWTNYKMIKKKLPNYLSRRRTRTAKKKVLVIVNNNQHNNNSASECVCTVCKYGMSLRHSSSCRANNNNNVPAPSVPCGCPPMRQPQSNATNNNNESVAIASTIVHPPLPSTSVVILLSISLLALPFLPAANLFFYVGFVVAERILYLPSVGYCLLVGLGLGRILDSRRTVTTSTTTNPNSNAATSVNVKSQIKRRIVIFLVFIVILLFCVKTVNRNMDWKNEESLYRSAVKINPPKGKKHQQITFYFYFVFQSL